MSRVGWIIFCSKTRLQLTGTFGERSPAASSYHAEMLGLCALHLFAIALLEFHKIQEWKAMLCCNNKRALELSSYAHCRIWPSAKCTDILRSLKAKMQIHRKIHVRACVQTYGHVLIVAPMVPTTAVKLHMQHASQTRSDVGNDGGFPQ